jgi:hypothetical protein
MAAPIIHRYFAIFLTGVIHSWLSGLSARAAA